MSIKDEIKNVQAELSGEEKLLSNFIKSEQFFKKYKLHIISILTVVIVAVAGTYINTYLQHAKLKTANEAFLALKENPSDDKALQTLKENNEKMYQLFLLNQAIKEKKYKDATQYNASKEIKDIANYHKLLGEKQLQNYTGLYEELALLIEGYHLLKKHKFDEAKTALAKIPEDSTLAPNVDILMHYLAKAR